MSISEAVALWIKARADRLAHRHEWEPVVFEKIFVEERQVGYRRTYTCKTCEKSKVVKTY